MQYLLKSKNKQLSWTFSAIKFNSTRLSQETQQKNKKNKINTTFAQSQFLQDPRNSNWNVNQFDFVNRTSFGGSCITLNLFCEIRDL